MQKIRSVQMYAAAFHTNYPRTIACEKNVFYEMKCLHMQELNENAALSCERRVNNNFLLVYRTLF